MRLINWLRDQTTVRYIDSNALVVVLPDDDHLYPLDGRTYVSLGFSIYQLAYAALPDGCLARSIGALVRLQGKLESSLGRVLGRLHDRGYIDRAHYEVDPRLYLFQALWHHALTFRIPPREVTL